MMHWWCTDDAIMIHWWCTDEALMMRYWCTKDALRMHWWCMSVIFDILEHLFNCFCASLPESWVIVEDQSCGLVFTGKASNPILLCLESWAASLPRQTGGLQLCHSGLEEFQHCGRDLGGTGERLLATVERQGCPLESEGLEGPNPCCLMWIVAML